MYRSCVSCICGGTQLQLPKAQATDAKIRDEDLDEIPDEIPEGACVRTASRSLSLSSLSLPAMSLYNQQSPIDICYIVMQHGGLGCIGERIFNDLKGARECFSTLDWSKAVGLFEVNKGRGQFKKLQFYGIPSSHILLAFEMRCKRLCEDQVEQVRISRGNSVVSRDGCSPDNLNLRRQYFLLRRNWLGDIEGEVFSSKNEANAAWMSLDLLRAAILADEQFGELKYFGLRKVGIFDFVADFKAFHEKMIFELAEEKGIRRSLGLDSECNFIASKDQLEALELTDLVERAEASRATAEELEKAMCEESPQSALVSNHGRTASKRCKVIFMEYKMSDGSENLPFVNDLPKTVSLPNYVAAVQLALKYASAGVEGHLHGHTLVLGDADTLLSLGTRNRFDPFDARHGDIKNEEDFEEIRRCLDADGMTLIDGTSGAPVANKFFSSGTSSAISGGARSKSAFWMAEQAESIVIKVSEDSKGEVVVHCGKGQGKSPCTAEYQKPNKVAIAHCIWPMEVTGAPVIEELC